MRRLGRYHILQLFDESFFLQMCRYSYDANCSCPYGAGGDGDLYLDFLEKEVMPMVKVLPTFPSLYSFTALLRSQPLDSRIGSKRRQKIGVREVIRREAKTSFERH